MKHYGKKKKKRSCAPGSKRKGKAFPIDGYKTKKRKSGRS